MEQSELTCEGVQTDFGVRIGKGWQRCYSFG
jgi:hypothetical protein